MTKFGGYSIGFAQIDDEVEENLTLPFCLQSTISLLASRSDVPDVRCFSIGSMKNQYDAFLESFGTPKKIINSLSLPSITFSPLQSYLFSLLILLSELSSSFRSSHLAEIFEVKL